METTAEYEERIERQRREITLERQRSCFVCKLYGTCYWLRVVYRAGEGWPFRMEVNGPNVGRADILSAAANACEKYEREGENDV